MKFIPEEAKDYRRALSFKGQANKQEFWFYSISSAFLIWLFFDLRSILQGEDILSTVLVFVCAWIYVAAHVRRVRDAAQPMSRLIALLLPLIGWAGLFAWLSYLPSKEADSKNGMNKKNLSISEVFSFKGSIKRKEFWLFIVMALFLGVALNFFFIEILKVMGVLTNIIFVSYAASVIMFWIVLAASVKRLRDMGKSEAYALLYFIPFLGFLICLFWFGFASSKQQEII